ncbi:transferase hexapeptide repeat family protein [Sedimenticola selenatireducens]|uniref:Phenylacetic acid degradation protein PaaY n=1 Tax=Sedimenticola selenatireducens TaxID=191960 RepID=A0A2N6CTU7_9GAMM|nr:transferase hexapeptide repeat family protein [Sedimenticola selenatireducens]PLX60589.1 MAG: phenylacetic acid degradation protein PaaY [Sedimenticola selenatireducens]
MARVYEIAGMIPVIDRSAFVHPDAVIIGDVVIGPGCYIGPCACIRGDFGRIEIGTGVNIQDNCVVHSFPEVTVRIADDSHIGHGAVIHACEIKRNALIGMNSVIMDRAVIGENAFVAAMAFVKAGMQVEPNTLVAGMPARMVRTLSAQELEWKIQGTDSYKQLAVRSINSLRPVEPLEVEEPGRKATDELSAAPMPLTDIKNRTPSEPD